MKPIFLALVGAVAMLIMEGCLGLSESGSDASVPRFSSAILESCGRETAYGGIRTSDHAILIAGSYSVNYSTLFLEKLSDKGELLWQRKIDTVTYFNTTRDMGYMIEQTPDGGFVISAARGTSTFVKTDSGGAFQWMIDLSRYQPGYSSGWNDFITAITLGPQGEVLALGVDSGAVRQIHLDAQGKVFRVDSAGIPRFAAVRAAYAKDGFLVVGLTDSGAVDSSSRCFSALKFDFEGKLKARKDIGIRSGFPAAYRNCFRLTLTVFATAPDGGAVAYGLGEEMRTEGGYTSSQLLDPVLIRLDGNLGLAVAKTLPRSQEFKTAGYASPTGEFTIIGYTPVDTHGDDDGFLAKYSADGERLWEKRYGGASGDYFMNYFEMPGNTIMAVGKSYSYPSTCPASANSFLLKLDADGNVAK